MILRPEPILIVTLHSKKEIFKAHFQRLSFHNSKVTLTLIFLLMLSQYLIVINRSIKQAIL